MIKDIELLPPNLAAFQVKRKSGPPQADLITMMDTPYPVLKNYKKVCRILGIKPFAGGNHIRQGPTKNIGYITSGYRFEDGIHGFALAIDIFVWPLQDQIRWIKKAIDDNLFTRAGFYPHHKIIHLDMASEGWMERHGGRRYWVCQKVMNGKKEGRKYTSFDQLDEAIDFTEGVLTWKH